MRFNFSKRTFSYVQLFVGIFFGVGTYALPLLTANTTDLIVYGSLLVVVVFASMFYFNRRILAAYNSAPITRCLERHYFRADTTISRLTVDWMSTLNDVEAQFAYRAVSFALLSRPFEINYDTKPKKSGIEAYLLYFETQPPLMNLFFDNRYEIDRAIDMGLLHATRHRLALENRECVLYRARKAIRFSFKSGDQPPELYTFTDRAMDILEAMWDEEFYTNDRTAINVYSEKLRGAALLTVSDYSVVDHGGFREVRLVSHA